MRPDAIRLGLSVLMLVTWLARAEAQDEPPPPALPPYPADPGGCYPDCREGYFCHRGQCISECNPPCDQDQVCERARCYDAPRPAPPPPPFPPSETQRRGPPLRSEDEDGGVMLRFELGSGALEVGAGPRIARFERSARRHDGFMLRLALGLGGASEVRSGGGSRRELSGGSGMFSVDVGGALRENLILHGRFASATIMDPDVSINDRPSESLDGFTVDAFLLGPGLTYYFMPANVYVTGVVGLSWLRLEWAGVDEAYRDTGVGLNFDLGKEWWVRDQWGLGVAARLFYSFTSYRLDAARMRENFTGLALLFSVTYQ